MKTVGREDDYREGCLQITVNDSGDVSVRVWEGRGRAAFTFVGPGGGSRSPRTRRALRELADAMEADAKELPDAMTPKNTTDQAKALGALIQQVAQAQPDDA